MVTRFNINQYNVTDWLYLYSFTLVVYNNFNFNSLQTFIEQTYNVSFFAKYTRM